MATTSERARPPAPVPKFARRFAIARRFGAWWDRLNGNTQGAIWTLASGILFSFMGVGVKVMGQRLPVIEVAFFRSLFGLVMLLPFLLSEGPAAMRTQRPWLNLLRAVLGTCGMFSGFYAMSELPLADAIALGYARPLFLVILAILVLAEVVHLRRGVATVVGFLGVLIMLRPTGTIEPAALVAVAGAAFAAGAVTCVRILSRTDGPNTLVFYSSVMGALLMLLPMIPVFEMPGLEDLLVLLVMTAFGISAQMCFVRAYAVGEAMALAPYDYVRLIFIAALGFLVFGDMPDLWVGVGAAIIVGSTYYILRREAAVRRTEANAQQKGEAGGP